MRCEGGGLYRKKPANATGRVHSVRLIVVGGDGWRDAGPSALLLLFIGWFLVMLSFPGASETVRL